MSKSGRIWIDSFTSLDDLKPAQVNNPDLLLHALKMAKRVSTFELSERPSLCNAIEALKKRGLVQFDQSLGYPWIGFIFPEPSP